MEEREFYSQLAEILDTDVESVNPGAQLEELGWSSLAVVSFIAFADESFSTIVGPRHLAACKTVGDLMQLLDGKIAVRPA
jgi:acyl carrier protein